ncbi:MAG TPA: EamA family transporter [Burkholderiaceae bacterium]|nr:EamA family transporter [Burkholderiaceae bacterium]
MPPRHLLLALLAVFIWGTNFVVIKIALNALPPLLLATLRFAAASLPFLFFVKRPSAPWKWLVSAGVAIGAGQFGLLFVAMRADIAPGLASLVIQIQVFFTIVLAAVVMHERVQVWQIIGLILATFGIATIAWHLDATVTALGLTLVLIAALCWALGNLATKLARTRDMFAFTIWSSVFAVPPLLVLSLSLEGWPAMRAGLLAADASIWTAVLWQALGNTILGYGIWNWLLARHPAAAVTPMALLVPVFGMAASAQWLGEPMQAWKLTAAACVILGIGIAVLWPKVRTKRS